MFCGQCGAKLPDNAAFCGKCGSRVDMSALKRAAETAGAAGRGRDTAPAAFDAGKEAEDIRRKSTAEGPDGKGERAGFAGEIPYGGAAKAAAEECAPCGAEMKASGEKKREAVPELTESMGKAGQRASDPEKERIFKKYFSTPEEL